MGQTVERALELHARGQVHEAIDLLSEALGSDFKNSKTFGTLIRLLLEAEMIDRAEALFARALAAPEVPAHVSLNYATFLSATGRPADAEPHYSAAMARSVGDLQRLVSTSDLPAAARRAIDQMALAECNLARTYHENGKLQRARLLAEKWLTWESRWQEASHTVVACIDALGLDALAEFAAYHAAGRAAPDMVASLVHDARSSRQSITAVRTAANACSYLRFDWVQAVDGFALELERAWRNARLALVIRKGDEEGRAAHDVIGRLLGLPSADEGRGKRVFLTRLGGKPAPNDEPDE